VANGVALMGLLGFFLYSVVFILPVFLTRSYHYTATQTGAFFIPGSLITAAMMPFIGQAMTRGVNPKILITIGLLGVEFCLFLMTKFSPMSPKDEILRMLYVRGAAMAFLFVPINSSILSQFKGATLGQVSGLMNLFRQIGGSVGIAAAGTLLTMRNQQNYLNLASKVSLLDPNTQLAFYQGLGGFGSKMTESMGMATGRDAILRAIYGRIQSQAFMLSFLQLVWVVMGVFVLAFIPLYRLQLRNRAVKAVDSH
jgi:DHA2 family multidrug resistance protein